MFGAGWQHRQGALVRTHTTCTHTAPCHLAKQDNYLDPLWQAWLSSVDTVPSTGLPAEYFDTPAKYFAYSFLGIVALLVVGFFVQ